MRQQLTELEQCVVGVVWRDGPLTAYEVAATFASSLSSYWSGSAGAIYPLVARLRKRGLLQASSRNSRRTLLETTPAGVASLRDWLTPPHLPAVGAPSFDPVRTRLFFIGVLPPAKRLAFIREAENATQQQVRLVRSQREIEMRAGNLSEAIGHLGALYELRARLRWLREVRTLIAGKHPRGNAAPGLTRRG